MDAEVVTIDADNGIAVIRKRFNRNVLSNDWQQFLTINDPISMLTMKHLQENRENFLKLVSWNEFKAWIHEN